MISTNTSKVSAAIVLSLLIAMFIVSDAAAQERYCDCYSAVNTVAVRRAPVRRVSRRAKVRTIYRTAKVAVVTRPVYRTVYVPVARNTDYVAYADVADCDEAYAPAARVVVTEPAYSETYYSGYDTARIARGWGRRDGFKDGYKAALKYRVYDPENNGDFRDADNGYKRRFGDRYLYRSAYQQGYVNGYDAGYRAVAPGGTYKVIRY